MIKSFVHKGVEKFFKAGNKSGIVVAHASRLGRQLAHLNSATKPQDMDLPGWDFHELKGKLKGTYSVSVNGNWRLTFKFDGPDAEVVDYQDYH
ncbi:type II toxin-antitoxin system RelE/ParE family toxin [Massilia solisilvae]|uniref:Type II toxin-antitoxin system RelE/ParE family toxin n=1 Tax=Massilia solisilvae TaxID=1811225 RepID=A0ABT2BIN7_9BURK|nr:type II toxin-antitoxin system RelE/ParE family toxin [Massilia solisilvae]MCS0608381.1 type II toxin-antitoxin system RelE/ParE family toxin [Massilia solisilvae]